MSMGTPPDFQRVLLHIVNEDRHNLHTLISVDNEPLLSAIKAQFQLGWNAFVEGVFTIEWARYVATFLPPNKSPKPWLRELTLKLWDMLWMMWDHRCKLLHTKDLSNKIHDMNAIDDRIYEICQHPPKNILPHESSLFHHTVESLSLHTPRYRRIWLQRAEKIIQSCAKRERECKQLHGERNLMRRWLGLTQYKQTPTQQRPTYSTSVRPWLQTKLTKWRQPINTMI